MGNFQPWKVKKYHCCGTLTSIVIIIRLSKKKDIKRPIRFHDYPPSLQIINTVHQLQRGAPQQDQPETAYLPPPRWETDQLSICQELLRSTPQETQRRLWVPEMPLIPSHAEVEGVSTAWPLRPMWLMNEPIWCEWHFVFLINRNLSPLRKQRQKAGRYRTVSMFFFLAWMWCVLCTHFDLSSHTWHLNLNYLPSKQLWVSILTFLTASKPPSAF